METQRKVSAGDLRREPIKERIKFLARQYLSASSLKTEKKKKEEARGVCEELLSRVCLWKKRKINK